MPCASPNAYIILDTSSTNDTLGTPRLPVRDVALPRWCDADALATTLFDFLGLPTAFCCAEALLGVVCCRLGGMLYRCVWLTVSWLGQCEANFPIVKQADVSCSMEVVLFTVMPLVFAMLYVSHQSFEDSDLHLLLLSFILPSYWQMHSALYQFHVLIVKSADCLCCAVLWMS